VFVQDFREATRIELRRSRDGRRTVVSVESPDRALRLGSDPAGDVRVEGPGILPHHATLGIDAEGPWLEPASGAPFKLNGASVGERSRLAEGDWLLLGSTPFVVSVAGAAAAAPAPPAPAAGPRRILLVGRLPESDVCIEAPVVSRQHARLVFEPGGCVLEDLESTNGSFVNGSRVTGRARLAAGDRIAFASFAYVFDGVALRQAEAAGGVRLVARGLGKHVVDRASRETRHLLRGIDLAIEPGEFVVIFGTSGSGKSTLLDALSGRRPASEGSLLFNDLELGAHFDLFRTAIGYVPQQDIVHRKITIQRALEYTARLRLPEDTHEDEIERYVGRVLERVGLGDKAGHPIDTPVPLSGGQLKRVSLAVELISNPSLLFLDEATSGLDAGTDKRLMHLFADLAADGKSVVCVTHTLENVDSCDLVVLLHRGRLVWVGPPKGALDHFGIARLSEVYEELEKKDAAEWAERFAASAAHETWVGRRLRGPGGATMALAPARAAEGSRSRRHGAVRQALTLTRRYLDLILVDRRNLAMLLLQAPLIGIMVGSVFELGDAARRAAVEAQIAFVLVISAVWFGCLNSAREIVKELPIWQRERAVSVRPLPYLTSKLGPLAAIAALQVAGLLAAVEGLLDLSGGALARAGVLYLSALAATAMGLTLSALVNTSDKAIASIPALLIPQVILSGVLVEPEGAMEWLARLSTIAYWAFDAAKHTLDSPLVPTHSRLGVDLAALAGFAAAFLVTSWLALRRGQEAR